MPTQETLTSPPGRATTPDIPTAEEFTAEVESMAECLEGVLRESRDPAPFFAELRKTSLPFFPCALRDKPRLVFHRAVEVVRRLGGVSPAVALAVENHLFVVAALATLPLDAGEVMHARRNELIDTVEEKRWLVANTNSRVHGDKIASTGTVARPAGEGFIVSGRSAYMSLASEGDMIVFLTQLESGEPAIFSAPLKGNPQIEIGDFLFPDMMVESDTRKLTFHDLEVGPDRLLVSGKEHHNMAAIVGFEMGWHQALLGALGLGVASRCLEEGRLFLRAVSQPDGTPLAELDGMITDMGRLTITYQGASALLDQAGEWLAGVASQGVLDRAQAKEAFERACAAKYLATHTAEEILGRVRKIIGARSFAGGHAIERLSKEGIFAPLAGEVSAFIERRIGKRVLGKVPFLELAASRPRRKARARASALEGLRAKARRKGS